jgi:CRISPR/Cas system-associated protein endoribonuclease Cas2
MELDNNLDDEYGFVWFMHPFDGHEWVYKYVRLEDVKNLYEQDSINIDIATYAVDLSNPKIILNKKINARFDGVILNFDVPDEVSGNEALVYNIANELKDEGFVFKNFSMDELLFKNAIADNEDVLDRNNAITRVLDIKDRRLNNNNYMEEDNQDDNSEEDTDSEE